LRVLAVDTTTARESVALAEGGIVLGEVRIQAVDNHSTRLMPSIAFLLQTLGLEPADVEGYAVAAGPGSFTGLRVGIGTVQGLALGAGRPCAAISTLDALAVRAAGAADWIVAVMEAHRREVFGGTFDAAGRRRAEPESAPLATLLERVPDGAAFIGDGAERYREQITAARPAAVFPRRGLFLAGTVAVMGEAVLAQGGGRPASELRPLYLRAADIWKAAPASPTRG